MGVVAAVPRLSITGLTTFIPCWAPGSELRHSRSHHSPRLVGQKLRTDNPRRIRFIPGAAMPKRTDIHSVLIIGAGPIIIGQACEFDYSGTQACKALKEEGFRVVSGGHPDLACDQAMNSTKTGVVGRWAEPAPGMKADPGVSSAPRGSCVSLGFASSFGAEGAVASPNETRPLPAVPSIRKQRFTPKEASIRSQ